ncbi:hypothetical protein B0H14DRAFT_2711135 [Mycena olivaceomarginata]|nr:hypothetical protein B0H14DRAFT_2711135 [Mycena olivaceomarginata]
MEARMGLNRRHRAAEQEPERYRSPTQARAARTVRPSPSAVIPNRSTLAESYEAARRPSSTARRAGSLRQRRTARIGDVRETSVSPTGRRASQRWTRSANPPIASRNSSANRQESTQCVVCRATVTAFGLVCTLCPPLSTKAPCSPSPRRLRLLPMSNQLCSASTTSRGTSPPIILAFLG